MGWHTNYEVEFQENIDWDDLVIQESLQPFNVTYVYLRDMELPRVIFCVYSTNSIEQILEVMKGLYPSKIHYRVYNSKEDWITFT